MKRKPRKEAYSDPADEIAWFNEINAATTPIFDFNHLPVEFTEYEIGLIKDMCTAPVANKDLAQSRGVGVQGVKNHFTVLLGKFGVSSREELIAKAVGTGIVMYQPSSPSTGFEIAPEVPLEP